MGLGRLIGAPPASMPHHSPVYSESVDVRPNIGSLASTERLAPVAPGKYCQVNWSNPSVYLIPFSPVSPLQNGLSSRIFNLRFVEQLIQKVDYVC